MAGSPGQTWQVQDKLDVGRQAARASPRAACWLHSRNVDMADGKWIDGLRPDMSLLEAARQALGVRLKAVQERLGPALLEADKDPEHVHQLRVSTRRAGAALRIFSPCLPRKAYKRMRKPLRRLRRAAGAARDWDVFLAALSKRVPRKEQRPGLDFLLGYAFSQRQQAQSQLEEAIEKQAADFEQLVSRTLEALQDPAEERAPQHLCEHSRPLLTGLLNELNEAAGRDLQDYQNLHQVRIAGKRLRYALEVFVCCFVSHFHDLLYPAVTEAQEILGHANDSHVAATWLEEMRQRLSQTPAKTAQRLAPGIESLLSHHRRQM